MNDIRDQPIHVLLAGDDESVTGRAAASIGSVDTSVAVRTASDAETAVAAVSGERAAVDCLVQTTWLGDRKLDLTERVGDRRPDLPVILFVDDDDSAAASDALDAGVADYLPRHDVDEQCATLVKRIRRAVGERSTTDGGAGLVRRVTRTVVEADRRADLERLVCEECTASTAISFAWTGRYHPEAREIELTAHAGVGEPCDVGEFAGEDPDEERLPIDGDAPRHQARRRAVTDTEVAVVRDRAAGGTPDADQRDRRPNRAVAYVPLVHRDTLYGVAGVHADSPDAFTDRRVTELRELGRVAGYALGAVERRRALIADHVVELEFEIASRDILLVDLSVRADCELRLDGLLLESDGDLRTFVSVSGAAASDVAEAATDDRRVTDATVLSANDGQLRLTLEDAALVEYFAEQGAALDTVTATSGTGRAVLKLPPNSDVRTVVERIRERYPDIALIARHERQREQRPSDRLRALFEERLTDRQHEALQVAYHGGFFAWPRDNSGEEIAEKLGVTQPTFLQHLRTAERKLFAAFFEDRRSIYSREESSSPEV